MYINFFSILKILLTYDQNFYLFWLLSVMFMVLFLFFVGFLVMWIPIYFTYFFHLMGLPLLFILLLLFRLLRITSNLPFFAHFSKFSISCCRFWLKVYTIYNIIYLCSEKWRWLWLNLEWLRSTFPIFYFVYPQLPWYP